MEAKKGESWRRETPSLLPPPPYPIKNFLSPIPLGRPDTQAKKEKDPKVLTEPFSYNRGNIVIVFHQFD